MEGKLPPNQLSALEYKYITCHWKGKNRAHQKGEKKHKEEEMEGQFCYCGKVGKTTTSWTDSNPGRRFIGCERYGKDGACGFFVWVDPPMCARSRVVIPGLLRSIGRLEAQLRRQNKMKQLLGLALIASWVLWICVLAWVLL